MSEQLSEQRDITQGHSRAPASLGAASLGAAERDLVALGVAVAAMLLFVGNGSSVLTEMIRQINGVGMGPDRLLTNALLLNVALVIFGWRRYDELSVEVRQRRQAEAHARHMAETDALTGCLNRHALAGATQTLIAAAAARGQVVAVIMIDLDHFKQVNDGHGHQAGDRLLEQCAARMRALLPAHGLLARLGGDEFTCVVPFDPAHDEQVDQLALAIAQALDRTFTIEGFTGRMSASIGVTRSDRAGQADIDALLHMADIAMYQAKKQGRGHHLWFAETMATALRYRAEMEAGIRAGIARGEFVPYYEPQIDLVSQELVGFEMLARWHSPLYGIVVPDVFIPIAEEIGAIAAIGDHLLAAALEDARHWPPALGLSVNVSSVQLNDPWFAQKILKALIAANFPPSRLDIEISETCLHQNVAGVQSLIASLKNQGISISLDDFGTGYSSLGQLRQLPFDRIKIDRSFISSLPDSADSRTIVQTVCVLSQGMGLPITAEGVETQGVLDHLLAPDAFPLAGLRGQGHLIGLPQPADGTLRLIAERGLPLPSPLPQRDMRRSA